MRSAPNSYYVPAHKWILTLGTNGIFYALLGAFFESLARKSRFLRTSTAIRAKQGLYVLLFVLPFLFSTCVALPDLATTNNPPTRSIVQPVTQNAADNTRSLLARQLYIDPATIEVTETEAVEWPDACLGLIGPTEMCEPIITPGHIMTFRIDG